MKDFRLDKAMNPETILKIYSEDRDCIKMYDLVYILKDLVAPMAYSPPPTLKAFPKTLKTIKTMFTYFDCDNGGVLSPSEI